jgi:hypothetical protein
MLRHVKLTCKYEQKYFARQNSHTFAHSSSLLPDVSAAIIARELWLTSQEFSPASIIVSRVRVTLQLTVSQSVLVSSPFPRLMIRF